MRYGVLLDFIQWSTPMGWRWRWGARWRRARVYACGNQRKLQSAVAVVRTTAAHGYYHAHWVTWWPTSLPQRRCRHPDLRGKKNHFLCWLTVIFERKMARWCSSISPAFLLAVFVISTFISSDCRGQTYGGSLLSWCRSWRHRVESGGQSGRTWRVACAPATGGARPRQPSCCRCPGMAANQFLPWSRWGEPDRNT